ncbi:MAG: bifunctional nuclease family protein [Cryomorphaceae bacterium]|jgi:bifunctional DNase/RNase|nr:bifunctional nuclease family protein [Cryomorphaceae bacterium]MBT3684398.1 bifunctional nuclease family protein [Cryomorphaceae bacterium]MBT4236669.1 bifunctional nuclease family protein [Cryomorphaceae bacterium]MBT4813782.1 bifunctional nuclease family protein [Cryomorphaceae bacterium]MBT5416898.1 bifunctional nuclease family protein [Cryomorphaceae bacterium]|tara:strand:+ start:297 stop:923 length:627 start_codon:yes stop_codon:yes gene_type:complete
MELVELKIQGISYSDNTSGAFALILDELNGSRKLPIVIGGFEAQAIAIALEKKIKTTRPLTHELFKSFADKFNIKLNHVIIHKLIDGVFFSNIVCEKKNKIIKIDSRTSDAIALSLRFSTPIFVNKKVLDEAGFEDDERYSEEIKLTDDSFFETYKTDTSDENITKSKDLKKISTNKIKKMLEKSIQNEDYIIAAKLRDELNIRKSIK